jgi:K+-transporting ATPase KdpF subunit
MTDLILIAAMLILLALARGYVWACDRIAPAVEETTPASAPSTGEPTVERAAALAPLPLLAAAGTADWVGLALGVALLVYLLVTLLVPERFR